MVPTVSGTWFERWERALKPIYGPNAPYQNPQTLESIRRSQEQMVALERRKRLDAALVSLLCSQPHFIPNG